MSDASLTPEVLRRAAAEVASTRDDNGAFDLVAKVITEALLDQATHRTVAVSPSVLDAKLSDAKLSLDTVAVPSGKPLEILRGGARNPTERALVACLFARHLGTTLDRRDGLHSLRELLPSLDWLEFVGQYPPYTAARATLADDPRGRLDDLLRAAPITAPTDATRACARPRLNRRAFSDRPSTPCARAHAFSGTPALLAAFSNPSASRSSTTFRIASDADPR